MAGCLAVCENQSLYSLTRSIKNDYRIPHISTDMTKLMFSCLVTATISTISVLQRELDLHALEKYFFKLLLSVGEFIISA